MRKGYLALVLHAHLPFVRHPEDPEFLEEDWLFEGITETYIPLWQGFEGLFRAGPPIRPSRSLPPTLCTLFAQQIASRSNLRYSRPASPPSHTTDHRHPTPP